jgi:hypothetical protein
MKATIFEETITRRRALRGGVACAMAMCGSRGVFGALVPENYRANSPNLYAFAGATPGTTVIAVTWHDEKDRDPFSRICIHAGLQTWEFSIRDQVFDRARKTDDISVFIGDVLSVSKAGERPVRAVVIEVPNRALVRTGPAAFWAEYSAAGLRQRIGTPFLANLVAGDRSLATIYHSTSPAEDKDQLTGPVANAIACRLKDNGFSSNSVSRSRQLASAILPDVLHYDSSCPSGFTFAAQNGRHPSERTDEVVNAILNGHPSSASSLPSACQYVAPFPYFRQVI